MTLTDLFGKLFTFLSMIFFTILLFKLYKFWGGVIGIPVGYILGNILFYVFVMIYSFFKGAKKETD